MKHLLSHSSTAIEGYLFWLKGTSLKSFFRLFHLSKTVLWSQTLYWHNGTWRLNSFRSQRSLNVIYSSKYEENTKNTKMSCSVWHFQNSTQSILSTNGSSDTKVSRSGIRTQMQHKHNWEMVWSSYWPKLQVGMEQAATKRWEGTGNSSQVQVFY